MGVDVSGIHILLAFKFRSSANPIAVSRVRRCISEDPFVNKIWDLASCPFDLIAEASVTNDEKLGNGLSNLHAVFPGVVSDFQTFLVCAEQVTAEHSIWLSCEGGGVERVPFDAIEKVEADRDYMHIFANGRQWLQHSTLKQLADDIPGLMQINRSTLVRPNSIVRLQNEGGHWVATLSDRSQYRVTATYMKAVQNLLEDSSKKPEQSSKSFQLRRLEDTNLS